MKKTQTCRRSTCPVAYTLDIIGDRWAILIIRDIVFMGKSSYGEFANSEEGIATNVLADRLKRLEIQGIIAKKQDSNKLSKYVYSLTEKGFDLLPIMVEMIMFAAKHDKQTVVSKEVLAKIKRNKQEFINDLLNKQ